MNLNQIAQYLHSAFIERKAVQQLSEFQKISLENAYAIQGLLVSKRLIDGSDYHGVKMGFTSKAKMEQMGVEELIWGMLTEDMMIKDGGSVSRDKFIHPRVEPEIAFKLHKNISPNASEKEIIEAVGGVALAIEIIDSRYKDFKFSLEDVIADNCSSAGYCVGQWQEEVSGIANLELKLSLDGEIKSQGLTSAILDNPYNSLIEAARITHKYGHNLNAGSIVLAGAASSAVFIENAEEVTLEVEGWETVRFEVR